MAELFRVSNLKDTQQTMLFTFLLPRAATQRQRSNDILSRDFAYAGLKWRLLLTKRDRLHLSPYLELTTACQNLTCSLDMQFQLYNTDSFTQNEIFIAPKCTFTYENPRQGNRTFISLEDIDRRAGYRDQQLLLEITLKSPEIQWRTDISLESSTSSAEQRVPAFHSTSFTFGDVQWRLTFMPNVSVNAADEMMERQSHGLASSSSQQDISGNFPRHPPPEKRSQSRASYSESRSSTVRHLLQIQCVSKIDDMLRLKYRLIFGDTPNRRLRTISLPALSRMAARAWHQTEVRQQLFTDGLNTDGVAIDQNYQKFVDPETNSLPVSVCLFEVVRVSHVALPLSAANTPQDMPNGDAFRPIRPSSVAGSAEQYSVVHDCERQQWCVQATASQLTRSMYVRLVYNSVQNIPNGYARYVCWSLNLLPNPHAINRRYAGDLQRKNKIQPMPLTTDYLDNYFSQALTAAELSCVVNTNLNTTMLTQPGNIWQEPSDGRITLELVWHAALLLIKPAYCEHDDLLGKQALQMKRELESVQRENLTLERELHKYQQSLAGSYSTAPVPVPLGGRATVSQPICNSPPPNSNSISNLFLSNPSSTTATKNNSNTPNYQSDQATAAPLLNSAASAFARRLNTNKPTAATSGSQASRNHLMSARRKPVGLSASIDLCTVDGSGIGAMTVVDDFGRAIAADAPPPVSEPTTAKSDSFFSDMTFGNFQLPAFLRNRSLSPAFSVGRRSNESSFRAKLSTSTTHSKVVDNNPSSSSPSTATAANRGAAMVVVNSDTGEPAPRRRADYLKHKSGSIDERSVTNPNSYVNPMGGQQQQGGSAFSRTTNTSQPPQPHIVHQNLNIFK